MTDPRYKTYRWRQLSKWVRARDMGRCQLRLPKCKRVATCVDHRVEPGPPERGRDDLFWNVTNLQASCAACNAAKRNSHRNQLAREAERGHASRGQ